MDNKKLMLLFNIGKNKRKGKKEVNIQRIRKYVIQIKNVYDVK